MSPSQYRIKGYYRDLTPRLPQGFDFLGRSGTSPSPDLTSTSGNKPTLAGFLTPAAACCCIVVRNCCVVNLEMCEKGNCKGTKTSVRFWYFQDASCTLISAVRAGDTQAATSNTSADVWELRRALGSRQVLGPNGHFWADCSILETISAVHSSFSCDVRVSGRKSHENS
jgi:hypothetical protein